MTYSTQKNYFCTMLVYLLCYSIPKVLYVIEKHKCKTFFFRTNEIIMIEGFICKRIEEHKSIMNILFLTLQYIYHIYLINMQCILNNSLGLPLMYTPCLHE